MKTKNFLAVSILILSISAFNFSSGKNGGDIKAERMHTVRSYGISSAENLRTAMRMLWEDHIVWTRNVILNIVDNLPGTDQAVSRLLKNQEDIGNAIKPYYGDAAGEKLTSLLKPHITIAAEVVTAAKKGDKAALEAADKKWHANAEQIAAFLNGANPNWTLKDLQKMMNDHLKYTTDEAVARIKKDYDGDIATYGKVHEEILMMSDDLSNGIIKQFPEKFTN
ncbi:MAG TPA: hypothetical protein VMT35_00535 [Ignavibacteriaceae bacterium]|nr:hypothetical protein [Ignavibacteriaceae bacterium]